MFTCKVNGNDISNYVVSYKWSGDIDQAGRKLEFVIAYNTKDISFQNITINIGNEIYFYYQEDEKTTPLEIFRGVVFIKQRNTSNFTMEFTAFDRLIYLAKSKTTKKFSNITIENVIQQVANEMNIQIGNICDIGVYVDFIADNMSGTEIIKKAFDLAYAKNNKKYHMYMNQNKLYVIERSETIENYIANDVINVENTTHSESLENMINQIMITDKDGNVSSYIKNDDDINNFGMIQGVYKIDEKQDTQTQAKAMLKGVTYHSSLTGIGNIQCITGYAIVIQEEQLKGKFTIKSDRHSISNNVHKMELDLEYLGAV